MPRIIIKIGSKVLTKKDGGLNQIAIADLVEDLASLNKKNNFEFIIVSSGAVSIGRSAIGQKNLKIQAQAVKYRKEIMAEQILAAVGQPRLMSVYTNEFDKYKINCAQLLATRAVFADRQAYLSLRTVTENLLKLNIIPIFNENDVLSPEELDFSDNDQLACMIAAMLVADKLIILTNVDGVYDPADSGRSVKVIKEIKNPMDFINKVDDSNSAGKGGMKSKLQTADLITSLGIPMHIANGSKKNIVSKIMAGAAIGTLFPAKSKKYKALKNWLATAAVSEGKIYVSTYLADILRKKQTASILFAGIEKVHGDFLKDQVVEICDENGVVLGRGLSRYGNHDLMKNIKEYSKKTDQEKVKIKAASIVAVHYDYFVFC